MEQPRIMQARRNFTEQKAPTLAAQAAVARVSGPAALWMPPMVMALIARIYGSGGWPARDGGDGRWLYETPLCLCEFSQIAERRARLRLWLRKDDYYPLSEERGPVLADFALAFIQDSDLARMLTPAEAAELTDQPEGFVRRAIEHYTGETARGETASGEAGPSPQAQGEKYNAVALRQLLIQYCRDMRAATKGDDPLTVQRRAIWEQRQMAIRQTSEGKWMR